MRKVPASHLLSLTMSLFIPALGYSQIARLQFQHVTVEQGLSHPNVADVCQDSSGFMWFGTSSGLDRFDGREIKSMEMGPCYILRTAQNGDLWLIASSLYCLSFTRDTTINFGDFYQAAILFDEDSTIWIGGELGFFHLNPKNGQIARMGPEAKADGGVTSMATDRRGNLWLVTPSSILYFDKVSLRSRFVNPRSIGSFSSVAVAPDGTVWIVGGPAGQLCKLDPGTSEIGDVLENGAQVSAKSIAIDASGLVYVGTWAQGLKIYDPMTRNWETYRHSESDPQSLIDDNVNKILFDRDGNLWVATAGGVSWSPRWRRSFSRISAHTADEEIGPAEIRDIVEDEPGNLWLGTGGGLKKWDRKKETVTAVKGVNARISCLGMVHRDQLWIALARERSLMRLNTRLGANDNVPRDIRLPELEGQISAMFNDGDTTMWLGCTRGRIFRHDLTTGRTVTFTYQTPEQLFPHHTPYVTKDRPRMMYRDRRGELWIATGYGILSLDEQSGILRRHIHSRVAPPSPTDEISCVYEDTKGRFWVGNELGLDLFDRTQGTFRPILHSSLPRQGRTIIGILEDRTGTLWLQTDGKLLRYNHDTGELKEYGPRDGFPITYLLTVFLQGTRACVATSRGEFALGVSNEIVLFRPDGLWENPDKPRVAITGVEVFGNPSWNGSDPIKKFVLPKQPLCLDARHNAIEIRFAGLDYAMPSRIQYAVMLEPQDQHWSNLGTERSIRFANISPGSYRLRVTASNGDSVWSSVEASYRFEVLPPWWMSWWFRSFLFLATIGIVAAFVQLRMRRLLAQERLRLQIASDLHDDLGSSLSSIALVSENVSSVLGENHAAHRDLRSLTRTAREAADRLKDDVWVIKPGSDTLDSLLLKMKDVTQSSLGQMKHSFRSEVDGTSRQVPPVFRRNILFIYKEVLQNILKHSCANTVEIEVAMHNGSLTLDVRDNGRGFVPASVHEGNGLINLQRRAETLRGNLLIDSAENKGTHIRLNVRIP